MKPSEVTTSRPSFTKNVGSHATKPYTATFTATTVSAAVTVRPIMPRRSSARNGCGGTSRFCVREHGGSGPHCASTSRSIALTVASASFSRPTDSSQRGDSGIEWRSTHTITAPIPAMPNIQRQPSAGITT